jgi:hypothetical protein
MAYSFDFFAAELLHLVVNLKIKPMKDQRQSRGRPQGCKNVIVLRVDDDLWH